jgi:hypothetical protein
MKTVETIATITDSRELKAQLPVDLPVGTFKVVLVIDETPMLPPEPSEAESGNVWNWLASQAGTVEAPSDWATEHDHYLYGTPKLHDEPST